MTQNTSKPENDLPRQERRGSLAYRLSVVIATAASLNLALPSVRGPWIPLALAGALGCYGLVRKIMNLPSRQALRSFSAGLGFLTMVSCSLAASPSSNCGAKLRGSSARCEQEIERDKPDAPAMSPKPANFRKSSTDI